MAESDAIHWARPLVDALKDSGSGNAALDPIRAAMVARHNDPRFKKLPTSHPERHLTAREALAILIAELPNHTITHEKARQLIETGHYVQPPPTARPVDLLPEPPDGPAPADRIDVPEASVAPGDATGGTPDFSRTKDVPLRPPGVSDPDVRPIRKTGTIPVPVATGPGVHNLAADVETIGPTPIPAPRGGKKS